MGHGRGKPLPSPSFSSPVMPPGSTTSTTIGRGRGRGAILGPQSEQEPQPTAPPPPKKPNFFFLKEDDSVNRVRETPKESSNLPSSILKELTRVGAGRGKPLAPPSAGESVVKEENRHLRLYLGDDADGEKLAARIGPENMNKLVEGFEEMSGSVLPSPMEDAFVEALHTNYSIECEPEYLMEEFGTNPDIDEKPPIPLREALEKMKPFLMAYEGIQSHEEWEEVMKETMEQVPLLKEIVDHYSGPDRVTAKRQQEELERVAKTLPDSAPTSVKRFTDRALLSLQPHFNRIVPNM
ncbi:hypothetical protein LguiA_021214 [Lonicera macranthoides]